MEELDNIFQLNEDVKPYKIGHRCFYFSKAVILLVQQHKFDRLFISMFDQLIRSATSIGANVVEGQSGSSKKDWIRFLYIALKSANETKYWLCLIRETMKNETEKINALIREADEISKIIASIIVKASK